MRTFVATTGFTALLCASGCTTSRKPAPPAVASFAVTPFKEALFDRAPEAVVTPVRTAAGELPVGTVVRVRTGMVVDSSAIDGGYVIADVDGDVRNLAGKVVIPANSRAVLAVRDAGRKEGISILRLGLFAVSSGQSFCHFSDGKNDAAEVSFQEDAGRGSAHSAVHLGYGERIEFRLREPVACR